MALLKIIKLSTKTWKHNSDVDGDFILTKFYAKQEDNEFLLVETYGAKRRKYLISEIEVYDIGGTAETFANFEDLFLRLEALKYTGFYKDGDVDLTPVYNAINSKLDKSSTPSSVYTTDSGGLQVMKPTSDFKDVIEGYFNGTNFYTDAGFTNLITPESGKIYIALDTNKTYRWTGSTYVQFGGGEIYIKNISVSGGYTVDFDIATHRLTLTGNTTFTESNLPDSGFSKTITLHINGNFGVIFPASWTTFISGEYDGTATLNTIVIETIGTERKVQISQPD